MHQKPDGDAMGSTLGLYHFLMQFGHSITVISPTNWASFLDWMPGSKSVLDYEKETKHADELINQLPQDEGRLLDKPTRTQIHEYLIARSKK